MGEYLSEVGNILRNKRRRESFAMYAMGLMGDGERKSCEPIAARACGDPHLVDAYHQRLTYFLGESVWSDHDVRRYCAGYALAEMTKRESVQAWIVDDTGFLKQGKHSVGVQRQYTGSAGKITNCQIGVSLSVTTRSEHVPIDFELYLPHSWTEDPARRVEAHIPDDVAFQNEASAGPGGDPTRDRRRRCRKASSSLTRAMAIRASSAVRSASSASTTPSRSTLPPKSGASIDRGGLTANR
jgi:SRSO17 transposase